MSRKLGVALLALLIVMTSGACGRAGTETNEIGLIYEGGTTQEKKFRGILEPGATYEPVGLGSKVYRYRTDQRSLIAAVEGKTRDIAPITVVSQDDQRLRVEFQLYFKLNRDPKVLQKFHENIGVKTKAYEGDEQWLQLLNEYFVPQIERALESVALGFGWKDLYSSEEARKSFQDQAVVRTKENLRSVIGVGADYFCGPSYEGVKTECGEFTFTVGKPEPVNDGLVNALEAEQTSKAATIAQEQKNAEIRAKLEAEKEIVALYGPEGAILREAIASGKVQTFIIDSGGRYSVPGGIPRQ